MNSLAIGNRLSIVLLVAAQAIGVLPQAARADYPVGTSDVTYVDPDRGGRSIPADLYYPAQSEGPGAPLADPPPGGFASAAFGHGYQISSSAYAWIAGHLASIGCVTAVPRTAGGLFPDHGEFGLDLAFLAGKLRDSGEDPGSIFFGRMGPRTLVIGHSMGGGCSLLAAAGDTSITAVANLAAAETNPSAVAACAGIDRPALLFAGTNDCVTPPADHQIPMYEALGGWRTLVTITGASHCQFNAYSFLCDLGEFCEPGISRQAQQDLVRSLLEPWAKAVLLLDVDAAQAYQDLLETGTGFTYIQDGVPTGAGEPVPAAALPVRAYPNPFNAAVTIRISLDTGGPIELAIFDVAGRRVRTLIDGPVGPGALSLHWDGRDSGGRGVPSGVYLARLMAGPDVSTAKLVLIR